MEPRHNPSTREGLPSFARNLSEPLSSNPLIAARAHVSAHGAGSSNAAPLPAAEPSAPIEFNYHNVDLEADYEPAPDSEEGDAENAGEEEDPFPGDAENEDLYHEEEISDSASVVTLYLSQPEAPPAAEEEKKTLEQHQDGTIRYVPAGEDLRGERVKTAPPRPPTEIEELRGSKQFLNLETAAIAGSQLIQRSDGKFDLESVEGQDNCKKFLSELEKLFDSFKAAHVSRTYRNKFSQAYKVLYTEGSLCYLTEILDSAQEGTFSFSFSKNICNRKKNNRVPIPVGKFREICVF